MGAMLTDTYIFLGALLILAFTPGVLGLVPPNRWGYGIKLTGFENPEKWYPLQRRGGLLSVVVGVALVLAGVLLHWVAPPMSQRTQIIITVMIIPVFWGDLIGMFLIAQRIGPKGRADRRIR